MPTPPPTINAPEEVDIDVVVEFIVNPVALNLPI